MKKKYIYYSLWSTEVDIAVGGRQAVEMVVCCRT